MKHKIYKNIGKKIAQVRKEMKWTQEDLAEMLNLSRVTINNIENGRQAVTIPALYMISRLSRVSISSFVKDRGEGFEDLEDEPSFVSSLSENVLRELDSVPEKELLQFLALRKLITKSVA